VVLGIKQSLSLGDCGTMGLSGLICGEDGMASHSTSSQLLLDEILTRSGWTPDAWSHAVTMSTVSLLGANVLATFAGVQ
jgi:hypothetical protein